MQKVTKLKNGLNLITIPSPGTKATTVLALLPVGSRYETREISGASHFVEHLMFKGTDKRPNAVDISRELDAVGADYNAFTAKDYTGYYIKIDARKQEMAYDMIADIIFNSKFDEEEINRERGVIVEELRMYEDNPTMGIGLLFDSLMYGDCPLGWDEGGNINTVKSMSRNDLWNYYKSAYVPKNIVLSVSGNMDTRRAKVMAEKYFVKALEKTKFTAKRNKNSFEKFNWSEKKLSWEDRVAVKEKKVDQAHVVLGFPGLQINDPRRYAAAVMLNILGVGMSSRLFIEVRERRGLAYMVRAGSSSYRDTGNVYVQAGLDPARLPEALKVIKDELAKIAEDGVTVRELADSKDSIAGRSALAMEDSSAQAEWFAKQFWFAKQLESSDELVKKVRKVKQEEVKKIAKQFFDFEKMRLAVIGPVKKTDVLKMI